MNEPENIFSPPDPSKRVSELTPWRLQKHAVAIGMKMIDGSKEADDLSPEQVRDRYTTLRLKMAEDIINNNSVDGLPTTSPFHFEFVSPVQTKNGQTVERNTWQFTPRQYLGCLSNGIYPISLHRGKLEYHDALHAAELAIIQEHAPAVSQFMIDAATFAKDSTKDVQHKITELLDMFTDTFAFYSETDVNFFEWRATDILRKMNPKLSHEDLERKVKGLSLEAVSGIRTFVEESQPQI